MLELGLTGKAALVAGAGPGLGRSCAIGLAEAGASVVSVDIDYSRAAKVAEEVVALGGTGFGVQADLRKSHEAERAVQEAASALGGLDVVVDVIGEIRWGAVVGLTDEDWNYSVEGVIGHVFNLGRAAGGYMLARSKGGSFVSVSSVSGLASAPFHAPYGAAKAGVMSLVRSMAIEWAPSGIRVNAVAPGAVSTPRVVGRVGAGGAEAGATRSRAPLGRMGEPDEIAKVVVFLSSDLASYVSGQTIVVDGAASAQFTMGPLRADLIPDNSTLDQPRP